MKNCKACLRKVNKTTNPACSKCKQCKFCHKYMEEKADSYYGNSNTCSFYQKDKVGHKKLCSVCGDMIDKSNPECPSCDMCLSCHMCGYYNDSTDQDCPFHVDVKFDPEKKFPNKNFKCKRLVGVEWEYSDIANTKKFAPLIKWINDKDAGHHEDGSCMAEVVTAPIAGDEIKKQLTSLGKILDKGVKIDKTCGIHVHVDARDINEKGINQLMFLYKKVEPVLYILAGAERVKNNYCAPVKDTTRPAGHSWGLNLENWIYKSKSKTTVEFRMHKGTKDYKQVIHWAQLCASLVEFAVSTDAATVNKLPASALQILKKVYPQGEKWMIECLRDYRKKYPVKKRFFSVKDAKWQWNPKFNYSFHDDW